MMSIEELKMYLEPQFRHLEDIIKEIRDSIKEHKQDNSAEHNHFRKDLNELFDRLRELERKQAVDDARQTDGVQKKEFQLVKWGLLITAIGVCASVYVAVFL